MTDIQISIGIYTYTTPTLPEAKRGAVHTGTIQETKEQLDNDLIWLPCSFCGSFVLVLTYGTGEKCSCGAKRFNRNFGEGWKRGEIEWWFF